MRCFFSRPSGTNPSSRVYVTKSAGVCVSGHVGCVCERDCVTGLVRLLPPPSSDTALVSRLGFTAFRWQSMTATDSGRARFDRGARAVRLPLRGWEARCLENAFSGVSMHHHLEQAAYISVGDPLTGSSLSRQTRSLHVAGFASRHAPPLIMVASALRRITGHGVYVSECFRSRTQ